MTPSLPSKTFTQTHNSRHDRQICFLGRQNNMVPGGHFSWAATELSTYASVVVLSMLCNRVQGLLPSALLPLLDNAVTALSYKMIHVR